jgi:hypothetical protein
MTHRKKVVGYVPKPKKRKRSNSFYDSDELAYMKAKGIKPKKKYFFSFFKR